MSEFKFIKNKASGKWVILATKREDRPIIGGETLCPFCPIEGDKPWKIRIVKNKYPFAEIHEIIIHSPEHDKNIGELTLEQNNLIFKTFRERMELYESMGKVYIFNNSGEHAGESIGHPHTQLVVIPKGVEDEIPPLPDASDRGEVLETEHFEIFCPKTSEWPGEVWIKPKKDRGSYAGITSEEITDLAKSVYRVINALKVREGKSFPFNFYIKPESDWYFRFIPRLKHLGGFEIGTGIAVNIEDPKETFTLLLSEFRGDKE